MQWPTQQPGDQFLSAAPDAELPPLPSGALELQPPSHLLQQWQSRQENPPFQHTGDWQWHQAEPLQQLPSLDAALTGPPTPEVPDSSGGPAGSHDGFARPQYSESFNLLSRTSGGTSASAPAAGCWPEGAGYIDLAWQQQHYLPYQRHQQAQHNRDLQQGRRYLEEDHPFLDVDRVSLVLPDASKAQATSAEVWALLDAPQPPQPPPCRTSPAAAAAIVAAGRDFLRNSSSSNSSAGTPPWHSPQDGPVPGAQACKPLPAPVPVGLVHASAPAAPPAAVNARLAERHSRQLQPLRTPPSCAAMAHGHGVRRLPAAPAAAPCSVPQVLTGARVRSESGSFRGQDAAAPAVSPSREGPAEAAAALAQPVEAPAAPSSLRASAPAAGGPAAEAPPEGEVRAGEAAGAVPRARETHAWAEAKPESKDTAPATHAAGKKPQVPDATPPGCVLECMPQRVAVMQFFPQIYNACSNLHRYLLLSARQQIK